MRPRPCNPGLFPQPARPSPDSPASTTTAASHPSNPACEIALYSARAVVPRAARGWLALSRPSLRRRTLARNYSESGVELDGDDRAKLDMLESYMAGVGGEAAEGGSAGEESPARSMLKRALARSSPCGHPLLQRPTRLPGQPSGPEGRTLWA